MLTRVKSIKHNFCYSVHEIKEVHQSSSFNTDRSTHSLEREQIIHDSSTQQLALEMQLTVTTVIIKHLCLSDPRLLSLALSFLSETIDIQGLVLSVLLLHFSETYFPAVCATPSEVIQYNVCVSAQHLCSCIITGLSLNLF